MQKALRLEKLLEVRNLLKVYQTAKGEPVCALSNVSLDIAEGAFLSVIGPSGCGKSTLLRMLAGILPKSGGEILLKGTPLDGCCKDIGVVFQTPLLLPWRTVLENALLPAEILGLDKLQSLARARELLGLVGLGGFEDRYPYELSGGMQQRNALVRALVNDPCFLLLDEPFGALDAMTRDSLNLLLLRIFEEKKKTVFFVTHSIPEAVFLSDRILIMSSRPGRIVASLDVDFGRPRDLDLVGTQRFGTMTNYIRHRLAGQNATAE